MEENKDFSHNESLPYMEETSPEPEVTDTTETPAGENCCTGEELPLEETPLAEDACDTQSSCASEEPLPWYYGTDKPPRRRSGAGAFFAIFGTVFALCLALLVFILFLGDEGIDIVRTLYTERVIYVRDEDLATDLLTPNEAADVIRKSTVTVNVRTKTGSGNGSGFVYDDKGHICTNYHVIEDAVSIQVVLPDGTALDATVVGYDKVSDLAVLSVQHDGLLPVTFGSSAELLVGDDVVAVGTPANLNFAGTATFGKVSYTNRLLPLTNSETGSVYRKITVIQTDTSLNPGNSGGPMADMYGRVVGIVVRKITYYGSTTYEGVAFAIPIDGARVVLDAIIQQGSFTGDNPIAEGPSQLGLTGHTAVANTWYMQTEDGAILSSPEQQEGFYLAERSGVYVTNVSGAQARNRIQEGDIIVSINGLDMYTIQHVIEEVNRHYAGETVTVTVWRNGGLVNEQLRLGEGAVS